MDRRTGADPTAPKPLDAALAVWHESLFSARHDRLVALHPDGGVIKTSRPLPDGAAVFLELSLGTQSNAPKAEIDAVVIDRSDIGDGFYVRFVELDPAVSLWIERFLMGAPQRSQKASPEERRGVTPPVVDASPLEAPPKTPPVAEPPEIEPSIEAADDELVDAATPVDAGVPDEEVPFPPVDVDPTPLPAVVAAHASVTIGPEPAEGPTEIAAAPEPGPLPPALAAHARVTVGDEPDSASALPSDEVTEPLLGPPMAGDQVQVKIARIAAAPEPDEQPAAPSPVTGIFEVKDGAPVQTPFGSLSASADQPEDPDDDERIELPSSRPPPEPEPVQTLPLDALTPIEPVDIAELRASDLDQPAVTDDSIDIDVDDGPLQMAMGVPSMEGAPVELPELAPVGDGAPRPAEFAFDDDDDEGSHSQDVTVPDRLRTEPRSPKAAAPVVELPGPPPAAAPRPDLQGFGEDDEENELTRPAHDVDPAALFAKAEPVEGDVPLWDFEPEDSSARYPLAPAGTPEQDTHERLKHLFFSSEGEGLPVVAPSDDAEVTRDVTNDSLEVMSRGHGHTDEQLQVVTVAFTEEAPSTTYDGEPRAESSVSAESGPGPASVDFGPPTLLQLDVGDLDRDVSDVGNSDIVEAQVVEAGFDIDFEDEGDDEDEDVSENENEEEENPLALPQPTRTAPQTPVIGARPTRTDPQTPVWTGVPAASSAALSAGGKTDTLPFGISAQEVSQYVAAQQATRTTTQPMFASSDEPFDEVDAPVVVGTAEVATAGPVPDFDPPVNETLPFGISLEQIQQTLTPNRGRSPVDGSSPFAKNALADPPPSDPGAYSNAPPREPSGWTTVGPITPTGTPPSGAAGPGGRPPPLGTEPPADAVDLWTVQDLPGDALPVVVGNDGAPNLGDEVMADLASLFDEPKK